MNDFYIALGVIVAFYAFIVSCRIFGIYKKGKCPKCNRNLHRVNRELGDRILILLIFNVLPFRRYHCINCMWTGVRWGEERRVKRKAKSISEEPEETEARTTGTSVAASAAAQPGDAASGTSDGEEENVVDADFTVKD